MADSVKKSITGENSLSWGYESTGRAVNNSEFKGYGKQFNEKDVIGCYLVCSQLNVWGTNSVRVRAQTSRVVMLEWTRERVEIDFIRIFSVSLKQTLLAVLTSHNWLPACVRATRTLSRSVSFYSPSPRPLKINATLLEVA